jgi:hypothetical protein
VGSTTITVTAKGDGLTAVRQIVLQVTQAPGLQLTLSSPTVSMAHTGTGSVTLKVAELGGLNVPVALSLSGLPGGVAQSLSNPVGRPAQSSAATLTLAGSSKAAVITTSLTVRATAVSGGVTYTAAQALTLQLK